MRDLKVAYTAVGNGAGIAVNVPGLTAREPPEATMSGAVPCVVQTVACQARSKVTMRPAGVEALLISARGWPLTSSGRRSKMTR